MPRLFLLPHSSRNLNRQTMKRSENRILTTHVGSLIRSKAVIEAVRTHDQKKLEAEVADIVARQAKAGIDVVNDGEFGKSGWANYILERLSGFEPRPDKLYQAVWLGRDRIRFTEFMKEQFPRGAAGSAGHACIGADHLYRPGRIRGNLAALKAAVETTKAEDVFFTAVAPASVGYDAENEYYKSEEDYVFAIANALREEYLEIIKAGFVLQVDDAVLANMFDHLTQESPKNYYDWAELRVEALNKALEGIPGGPHPLSHLLRQLARAACRRREAVRHRRPDAEREGRRLFDRGRQCAPRARMEAVEDEEAAGRQDPDPRHHHASHHDGGASANWWPNASSISRARSGRKT